MKEITIITMEHVSKSFSGSQVLNDINLTVKKGEIIGIVGENGCGKSVLYKMICGLIVPNSGKISVFDKVISKGTFPDNIGIMLDNTGFIPYESAFDNLKNIARIDNKISDKDIKDCLNLVGLNPNDKKSVKHFSLGMKQRLGIAMAIMEKPMLLLLDEPFNALDKDMVETVQNLLLKLNRELNVTILLTSHNPTHITSLCHCIVTIEDGQLSHLDS